MRKFIKEIKKNFNPAYKQLLNKKRWPAPFETGYLKAPGRYAHLMQFDLAMWTGLVLGIIIGLLLSVLVTIFASIIFGFEYQNIVFFILVLTLLMVVLSPAIKRTMEQYRLGYMGECVVAEALGVCLRKVGWRLIHSFNIPGFTSDIDHIIVCPKGIFCVETKASRWTKGKELIVQGDKILFNNKEFGKEKPPIPRTKKAAIALRNFLKKQCPFVEFVTPIVLFADESGSSIHFYDGLIVGKSSGIKDIYKKIVDDMPDKLSLEQVNQVGKVLAKENRIDVTE